MATHYSKGRHFEYKVADRYRDRGFYVMRSAGSHGIADLIAINPETKEIKLIQCKSYKQTMSQNKKKEIMAPLLALEGEYILKAELVEA